MLKRLQLWNCGGCSRTVTIFGGTRVFRGVKGKERVPVPVAGPAFRGGVKFVIFYVFSSFLQPAAQIDPVQCSFPPVRNSSLDREEETRVSEEQRVEVTK